MSTIRFTQIICDILSDKPEIPGLPNSKMISYRTVARPGTALVNNVPKLTFLKLCRLQTLKQQEMEKGEMPALDALKDQAQAVGKNVAMVMCQTLAVNQDSKDRVAMIVRLMIEVVRDAIPTECDQLGREYYVDSNEGVMWRPVDPDHISF